MSLAKNYPTRKIEFEPYSKATPLAVSCLGEDWISSSSASTIVKVADMWANQMWPKHEGSSHFLIPGKLALHSQLKGREVYIGSWV